MSLSFARTAEKLVDGTAALTAVRQKLDAGLGLRLFQKYHDLASAARDVFDQRLANYKVIILGALVTSTGAKVTDKNIHCLRQLALEVDSSESWVLFDMGFRVPGKRQFLAALDNYKPGKARNFNDPSCHACGKTREETEKALLKWSGCFVTWFCDKARVIMRWLLSITEFKYSAGLLTEPLACSQKHLCPPPPKRTINGMTMLNV